MHKVLQQLHDLSFAIFRLDYAEVEKFLADETFPVNFFFPRFKKLPKDHALESFDERMIQLFLDCPRIDWLAPNAVNYDALDAFGIEYDEIMRPNQTETKSKVDIFTCLDPWFEKHFPQQANIIYDKMFAALENEPEEELERLPTKAFKKFYAFERAMKYCKDVNKRFDGGKTILHLVSESELRLLDQAKKLISLGADVNVQSVEDNMTPFMYAISNRDIDLCRLLVENGADLRIVKSDGNALQSSGVEFFLDHFELSEQEFKNFVKSSWFDPDYLNVIFAKYPPYYEIFMADFVSNLGRMYLAFQTELFEQLRPEDGLEFIKLRMSSNCHQLEKLKGHPFLGQIIFDNADELLHLAVLHEGSDNVYSLLLHFNADPNSVIDGLPPLFKTNCSYVIDYLIENGADPKFEVDGCKFFQREGFVLQCCTARWLRKLYDQGIDLFEPSPLNGKTIFDTNSDKLLGQKRKMTKELFLLINKSLIEYFSPIDADGNTLLHYHALKYYQIDSYNHAFEDLIKCRNKAGQTPLDLMVAADTVLEEICSPKFLLQDIKSFKKLEKVYDRIHGKGAFDSRILRKAGAYLLLKAHDRCSFSSSGLVKYFLRKKQISSERICLQMHADPVHINFSNFYYDSVFILLNQGVDILDIYFLSSFSFSSYSIYATQLWNRQDTEKIVFEFMLNIEEYYPRELSSFFEDDDVFLLLQENKKYHTKLYKYFFKICSSTDTLQSLLAFGLDPFELSCSRMLCEGSIWINDAETWRILHAQVGMSREDFENIKFRYNRSDDYWVTDKNGIYVSFFDKLRACNEDTERYHEFNEEFNGFKIPSVEFSQLDLNQVIGVTDVCSICKCEYEASDSIAKLDCNHIFHADCVSRYILCFKHCPYCRAPSPMPGADESNQPFDSFDSDEANESEDESIDLNMLYS